MASMDFKMNNLTITVSGVNGYLDVCTYTNLDPIDYVVKSENKDTGYTTIYRFKANTSSPTHLEGFRRQKTDSSKLSFLGATLPGA